MSSKTREFLQKICYKKAASVDMTQYGFIIDSYSMLNKPLELEKQKMRDEKTVKKASLCNNGTKNVKSNKLRLKTTRETKSHNQILNGSDILSKRKSTKKLKAVK